MEVVISLGSFLVLQYGVWTTIVLMTALILSVAASLLHNMFNHLFAQGATIVVSEEVALAERENFEQKKLVPTSVRRIWNLFMLCTLVLDFILSIAGIALFFSMNHASVDVLFVRLCYPESPFCTNVAVSHFIPTTPKVRITKGPLAK